MLNERVHTWNQEKEHDDFLKEHFTDDEVEKAIKTLHTKKACGYDNISTEHIRYAGPYLIHILTLIYNMILDGEYKSRCIKGKTHVF